MQAEVSKIKDLKERVGANVGENLCGETQSILVFIHCCYLVIPKNDAHLRNFASKLLWVESTVAQEEK